MTLQLRCRKLAWIENLLLACAAFFAKMQFCSFVSFLKELRPPGKVCSHWKACGLIWYQLNFPASYNHLGAAVKTIFGESCFSCRRCLSPKVWGRQLRLTGVTLCLARTEEISFLEVLLLFLDVVYFLHNPLTWRTNRQTDTDRQTEGRI